MYDITKTSVQITIESKCIAVNDEEYIVKDLVIPNNLPSGLSQILWFPHIHCYFGADGRTDLEITQSNWDKWVQPFVDQWQIAKDAHDQEVAEANSFPVRQAKALVQLNEDFETVKERSHIKSSLGFTVDANQTANENVNGLLITIGDTETVQFCDYNNQFHELTKADLETLQTEIIQNAQNLYQQKWVYRTQIEAATDNEGLDAVVAAISFSYMDFTPPAEEPTGDGEQAAETDQSAEQTE